MELGTPNVRPGAHPCPPTFIPPPNLQSTICNPQSAIPLPLPPSARDLEIHRQNAIELLSTYRVADLHKISQTRVRQIVARVNDWLAEVLPIPSEADIERHKRLAIHLAAAQLRHQIEQLKMFWDGSNDPKYLRQQTRAILALARLGVPPSTLDTITAQLEEEPEQQPTAPPPPTTFIPQPSSFPPSSPPIRNHQSSICNSFAPTLSPSLSPSVSPSSPPKEACSPSKPIPADLSPSPPSSAPSIPAPSLDLAEIPAATPDDLAGLDLMEKRLLTILADTSESEAELRQDLHETLTTIRQERASLTLKLSPSTPIPTLNHS